MLRALLRSSSSRGSGICPAVLEAVRWMLLKSAAFAVTALANAFVMTLLLLLVLLLLLLVSEGAVEGRRSSVEVPSSMGGTVLAVAKVGEGPGSCSVRPLHGLLWPDVDADDMPGADSAKRLGVLGSYPAEEALSELGSCRICFVGAEMAELIVATLPCKHGTCHVSANIPSRVLIPRAYCLPHPSQIRSKDEPCRSADTHAAANLWERRHKS